MFQDDPEGIWRQSGRLPTSCDSCASGRAENLRAWKAFGVVLIFLQVEGQEQNRFKDVLTSKDQEVLLILFHFELFEDNNQHEVSLGFFGFFF